MGMDIITTGNQFSRTSVATVFPKDWATMAILVREKMVIKVLNSR